MKNVNRDYLVKVNVKTAEIETPKDDMIFYVTDIWTSNIFFQLDFGKGNSLTDLHNENASDYDLTLRVVKPNKEHKELRASLLSQDSNFFVADIPPDFINYIGICECELFIETTINGRKETNTTDPFEYIVEGSVFSALDEVIEGNPDYPLVDTLATKEYVDAAIANISGGGTSYDDSELRTLISGKADISHTHTEYLTSIPDEYITETELTAKNYAPKNNPVFTGDIKGNGNFAVGNYVSATGLYGSHAEGSYTKATGFSSHAEGSNYEYYDDITEEWKDFYTTAEGIASHAEGGGTVASGKYQHVQGRCNIEDTNNVYAHIVGNGADGNRSNAHTLDWDGNGWYSGNLYVGGTSQTNANKVLSTADIKFTTDGKLSVTINGVTKKFNPA